MSEIEFLLFDSRRSNTRDNNNNNGNSTNSSEKLPKMRRDECERRNEHQQINSRSVKHLPYTLFIGPALVWHVIWVTHNGELTR